MGAATTCYPPPGADEMAVWPLNSLPLGFRFRPTDEELIDYYLRQKINGNGDDVWVIREIDVCKWEPWDLPDLSVIRNKDLEWFFFCPQDRKYPNGRRLNRATNKGYWKATGKDRKIKSGSKLIGMKKTLVFHSGRAPKGKRTYWVMHEYRPTLKELDGTNPGQNPYVLCRLFKKQDECVEGSNCDEADQTASTPTTANYSPEEIRSDGGLAAVSPSVATEDDKHHVVPVSISENTEEMTSNVIATADCHSDGCDAYDAQNKVVKPTNAEEDPLLNLDIFNEPITGPFNDKLFSPLHWPAEFYHPVGNEPDGHCGLQFQYGANENISELFDFNWGEISCEGSIGQNPASTILNPRDNGSGSESDVVEMANIPHLQALHTANPEEIINRRAPSIIQTTPEFHRTITSDLSGYEQKNDMGLFQNNTQMALSSNVAFGQVYNVFNSSQESRNYNAVVSGDSSTGIRIRSRQVRNEQLNMSPAIQGTAPRRIHLQLHESQLSSNKMVEDGGCAQECGSKPITTGESKASGNHAADEDATDTKAKNEPQNPESTDSCKISQQLGTNADSISWLKAASQCKLVRQTSKASSHHPLWLATLVFSVSLLFLVVFLANIWGLTSY